MKRVSLCLAALLLGAVAARADVRVSNLFGDNMVLQREMAVPIWGTADPGEAVTVKIGDAQASAQADAQGKWMVKLPAMQANAKPQELTISGKNTLTIKNVLVGDVWVCSGQSNMEFGLGGCNAPQDIAAANYPTLRRIKLDHRAVGPARQARSPAAGRSALPAAQPGFTAVGFYFARRIQKETGAAHRTDRRQLGRHADRAVDPALRLSTWSRRWRTSWGNRANACRPIASEMGKRSGGDGEVGCRGQAALATPDSQIPAQPQMPNNPLTDAGFPTTLYNGMIHPIAPYAIKGVLWYQGESNGGEGDEYYHKMRALVGGWRKVWNQGDFPFYFVQLANFQQPNQDPAGGDGWAKIRMAQFKSLQIPHTGMAVAIDLADADKPGDIHPKNKFDVGERLAVWALHDDYGKQDLVFSGPLYKSMKVEDGKIRVSFDFVGGGLMVGKKDGRNPTVEDQGGKFNCFAVAGEDKKWHWADAVIDGDSGRGVEPRRPQAGGGPLRLLDEPRGLQPVQQGRPAGLAFPNGCVVMDWVP